MEKLKYGETAVLEDNRKYTCFANLNLDGTDYIFLISNFKPTEVKFAEQRTIEGELQIKIVTEKKLKNELYNLFQKEYGNKNFN